MFWFYVCLFMVCWPICVYIQKNCEWAMDPKSEHNKLGRARKAAEKASATDDSVAANEGDYVAPKTNVIE